MRTRADSIGVDARMMDELACRPCFALAVLLLALMSCGHRTFAQAQSNPDSGIVSLAQQAEADLHDGKPVLAAAEYQKILVLDPSNIGAHSNLGLAYYLQGQFALAASEFEKALRRQPDLWNIAALCGLSEARSGQNEDAVPHLDQAFQHVLEPQLRMAVGRQLFSILFEAGDLKRASDVVAELQQLEPSNIDVLYAAHQVYSLLANRAFLSMTRLAPDSARMYQLRGDQMMQVGDILGAITAYRQALRLDPHLAGAHFSLGEVLSASPHTSDRDLAEVEYQRALADDPMDEKAECRLGKIERRRSNLPAATGHYKRALELRPDDPEANEGFGMVLMDSNSNRKASVYLNRAIQLDPTDEVAYYHLSLASRRLGDLEVAKREMEEFLKLKAQKENLKRRFHELPIQSP
jgi:tetratricopeptide (TPR) repeat protein